MAVTNDSFSAASVFLKLSVIITRAIDIHAAAPNPWITLKNNKEGVNTLTENPITNLLKENSLDEYSTIFYGRKIRTIDQFKLLSDQNLKDDLGIPLGDRLVFNHIINKLKEDNKDKKDE